MTSRSPSRIDPGQWRHWIAGALIAAAVLAGAASPAPAEAQTQTACKLYGPTPDRAYRPALLIRRFGSRQNLSDQSRIVIAHRGVWGKFSDDPNPIPENSQRAIDRTAKLGIEAIELDVHNIGTRLSSNALYLAHDYGVGRTMSPAGLTPSMRWNPIWGGENSNMIQTAANRADWKALNLTAQVDPDKSAALQNNRLLNEIGLTDIKAMTLRYFDPTNTAVTQIRDSKGEVVSFNGGFTELADEPMSLVNALFYIGQHYPGMTVILDLRHLDEITTAMSAVDRVTACDGTPARSWVVLKYFANALPGGWALTEASVKAARDAKFPRPSLTTVRRVYGNRALDYLWIPVVSGRLGREGSPGQVSLYPGFGPDQRRLNLLSAQFVRTFPAAKVESAVVGMEISDKFGEARKAATDMGYATMTSWRPPDLHDSAGGSWNWKDDGLGIFRTTPTDVMATAAKNKALILDDVKTYLDRVDANPDLKKARAAYLNAISTPIPGLADKAPYNQF